MSAEAQALRHAGYGEVSTERTGSRNGCRPRDWDTRAGSIELRLPKLRQGSYFPEWLLGRRRRSKAGPHQRDCQKLPAERLHPAARAPVLCDGHRPDLRRARSPRWPKPWRRRSIPYATVRWIKGPTASAGPMRRSAACARRAKVRKLHVLIATGVNGTGYREILGMEICSEESGAGWLSFFRGLVARGLSGVCLVTSDAHRGLVEAIGATLPGASPQRCRTHYLRDLPAKVPKSTKAVGGHAGAHHL